MTTKVFTLVSLGLAAAAFSGYLLGTYAPGKTRVSARAAMPRRALSEEQEELDANSARANLRRALAAERARSDALEAARAALAAERDALRAERDALSAEIRRRGAGRAPLAPAVAQRERRKDELLRRWNEIVGDPLLNGELPDYRRRRMFAELYADLSRERTPEEVRLLYDAFLIGYRPYWRAMDDLGARSKFIHDAVELRMEWENLTRLRRGLYRDVLPLLDEDERRACERDP